jgi:cytidyltransferase-like protein
MKILAVYPGRFQPFHKGHAQVFQWLKNKFGSAVIATSDKVEAPKSPFNFKEKKSMMRLAGVPANSIKHVTNPYIAREILQEYDPKTTVLIFAVSQKDMDEDPRFSFAKRKDGKPGYLQPYKGNEKKLKPFGDVQSPKGYVVVTPTFTFDVLGKPATSASELRKQFVTLTDAKQKAFIQDLFGGYDTTIHKLMKTKIGAMERTKKTVKQLKEEVTRKELAPMMDSFVSFASEKLGIKSLPSVRFKGDGDEYNSFAAYDPAKNELSVSTKHRHPMDVFRSVAHELVHHKQNEEGRIGKDIAKEGSTGSDVENEANAEAGKIMRWFAQENPDFFSHEHINEEFVSEGINDPGKLKAIFLAGGPGSGKDYVMNATLAGEGLREINSDVAFEYLMKKNNLDLEMPENERVERDIVRGRAKNTTKEQERLALAGRLGIIINGTADDLEKISRLKRGLEADGYETMMVFVNTSDEVSRQRNVERGKMGKRKVPDSTNKQGIPDGSSNIRKEKWDLAQKNIGELQKIFGNDRFVVIDNTLDARKLNPEEKQNLQTNFNRVRRMAQQFVRAPNKNPAAAKWIAGEMKKRGITNYQAPKSYKTLNQVRQDTTPKGDKPSNDIMSQARRLGLSYYGFGRFGRKVNGENKVLYHSKGNQLVKAAMNEEKITMSKKGKVKRKMIVAPIDEAFNEFISEGKTKKVIGNKTQGNYSVLPDSDGIGPEVATNRPLNVLGFTAGMTESIVSWVNNPRTQAKFVQKYGDLAEKKLEEAALRLESSGCGKAAIVMKKSVKSLRESEAWQRKEGQNPNGGLNEKGRKSYNAKHGANLKRPQPEGGNRRDSYCARSKGQMKMWPKAAKDPNSRLRKARRAWNCEE